MENRFKLIVDSLGKDRFKFNEPISNYTVSGIGGPASVFFIAFTIQELVKVIDMCRQLKLPHFLFGTGSKMMIADKGFDGLVIKNRTKNISTVSVRGKVTKYGIGVDTATIEIESGVSIPKFIEYLNSQGLETAKFSGIPGSIGGNLFWNKFLQTATKSIKVYNLKSEIEEIGVENLSLKRHIILSGIFKVKAK